MEFSTTNVFFLNNSAQPGNNEPCTNDGWSFQEVKLLEKTLAEFKGVASVAFFEEAARRMYWRDMNSIVHHYEMMKDLKTNEEGKVDDRLHTDENGSVRAKEPEFQVMVKERKKSIPWTKEEHRLFLMGLAEYGQGKWKKISKNYVTNKTPTQVASHAQKFNRRTMCKTPDKKRRRSIHDIRCVAPAPAENVVPANDHVLPPPPPPRPPAPAPQVLPNNYYHSVANGADHEATVGHQYYLMTQTWTNQRYI